MNNLLKIIVVAAFGVLISSCCNCKKGASRTAKPFVETSWSMVQYKGANFDAKDGYTIVFSEEGRLTGKGDCNRLTGSFTKDHGKLTISKIAGTRMMCPNQKMETEFIEMLTNVDAYMIDGELISLFTNGEQVAILEAVVAEK